MNDILPKPFTKEGLLDMLEVSTSSSIEFRPKIGGFNDPGLLETSYASQSYATNDGCSTICWGSSAFRCEFRTGFDDECYDNG